MRIELQRCRTDNKVQTFEQGGGDEVLEPGALFLRYITIIEEIDFVLISTAVYSKT